MSLSNSPPPLMGDVQVALVEIHSLLVEESCGGGSQNRCQVWRGAQAQPCSACPKQPVYEPEPSAVYFTYSLIWCSASGLLFHPRNETNPPIHTWATKALGSAGRTPWLLFWFLSERTKDYTSQQCLFKAVSFQRYQPSYKLNPLLTVMTRFASPLFLSVFKSFPSTK